MFLRSALEQIPGTDPAAIPDVRIDGVSYDSRQVRRGDLFVAIRGQKTDGARFARQAADRGAAAVAAESPVDPGGDAACFTVPDARRFLAEVSRIFYGDPASRMRLAAVTGTNGKTTTAYVTEAILTHAGMRCCLAGTIAMRTVSRQSESRHTTPEAPDLSQFLRQALQEGCTHGALEVSSHSLALQRVFGMKFAVGIFTNLTPEHMDFHGTMEDYFGAKQKLFDPENGNRVESGVFNIDDPYGKRLADGFRGRVVRFGFGPGADIRVLENTIAADGTDLRLATPAGDMALRTGLIGRHNAYNIMAAAGAALCLDIPPEAIAAGVASMGTVPGRFERVEGGRDVTVIVDYAHSPDALENLLELVSGLPHERIITVFGCGGDRDRRKRPVMGSIAAGRSDITIVTSDNPRSENPMDIIGEILGGVPEGPGSCSVVPDRREAIGRAISLARKGDIVVIAGKGHENYQIIGGERLPFDDRQVAGEFLRRLRGGRA